MRFGAGRDQGNGGRCPLCHPGKDRRCREIGSEPVEYVEPRVRIASRMFGENSFKSNPFNYLLDHQLTNAISKSNVTPVPSDSTDTTYSAVPRGTVNTKKSAVSVTNMPMRKKSFKPPGATAQLKTSSS